MYDKSDTDRTLENIVAVNEITAQEIQQSLRPSAIGIEGRIYPINSLSAAEKQEVLETIKTVLSLRFGCTEESITLKFI